MVGYDAAKGGYVSSSGAFYPTKNKDWVPKGNTVVPSAKTADNKTITGGSSPSKSSIKSNNSKTLVAMGLPTSNLNNVTPSASDKTAMAQLNSNPYTSGLSSPFLGTPKGSSSSNKVSASKTQSWYDKIDAAIGGWLPGGSTPNPITKGYTDAKTEVFGLVNTAATGVDKYVNWVEKEAPEMGAAYGDTIGQFLNKLVSGAGQGVGQGGYYALSGVGAGLGQGLGSAVAGTGQGLGYGLGGTLSGVGQGLDSSGLVKWVAIGFFGYLIFKEVSK